MAVALNARVTEALVSLGEISKMHEPYSKRGELVCSGCTEFTEAAEVPARYPCKTVRQVNECKALLEGLL